MVLHLTGQPFPSQDAYRLCLFSAGQATTGFVHWGKTGFEVIVLIVRNRVLKPITYSQPLLTQESSNIHACTILPMDVRFFRITRYSERTPRLSRIFDMEIRR
jgi:hypothetical protein